MFEGNMFFQLERVAMETSINSDTFILIERSTCIHEMLNDFQTSIRLLYEVDIRIYRDLLEFIGSILLQEGKWNEWNSTNFLKLSYLLIDAELERIECHNWLSDYSRDIVGTLIDMSLSTCLRRNNREPSFIETRGDKQGLLV
jgi:hypothetical protein